MNVYSEEIKPILIIQNECSWIELIGVISLAPYVTELVLSIKPLPIQGVAECVLKVNETALNVTVEMGGRGSLKYVSWIEGSQGNTLTSNGDSAFTNYFSLYQSLNQQFIVDVFQTNNIGKKEVCLCFDACVNKCGIPFFIMGVEKRRSLILQEELKEHFGIVTIRHGKATPVNIGKKTFRNVLRVEMISSLG